MYKLNKDSIIRVSDGATIPINPNLTDYQTFVKNVKEQGVTIVEGEDVKEPSYIDLRTGPDGYASIAEQQDMQYRDAVNGTTEFVDHIAGVKTRFDKTTYPVGVISIAPLPQWVVDLVKLDQAVPEAQKRAQIA